MLRWPIRATTTGTIDVTGIPAATTIVYSRPFQRVRFLDPPDAAAGANWLYNDEAQWTGKIWRFASVGCRLFTDANVGNRFVALFMDKPRTTDSFTRWASWASTAAITANAEIECFWAPALHASATPAGVDSQQGSLPDGWFDMNQNRLGIFVAGIKAGDVIRRIVLNIEEWDSY